LESFVAKLKKSPRSRPAAQKAGAADLQQRAEHLSRSLVESAQQIWMAGVGAFTRAQGEGSKLFEALVTEGMNIEKTTRQLAGGRVDAVRDAMEDKVGAVRGRASDTWDRLEKVFEDRVQRALNRLGIPGRDDLNALSNRVDALTSQLRQSGAPAARAGAKPARPASKRAAAPRSAKPAKAAKAAKPAKAAKAAKAAKRPAKAPAKSASPRRSLPRAPRPNAPRA
jgi:poly(hydroxyalkanoate) granule-associated protein